MTYNLQSLITILQKILNPQQTHPFVTDNKPQLESLLEKAVDLSQYLPDYSCPELESLGCQIRDAIYKAEDIIECHMLDQVDWWRAHTGLSFAEPDLQKVMEEFDSAKVQAMKIEVMRWTDRSWSGAADLPAHPRCKVLVGVDKALMQLIDQLTGEGRDLEFVSIVGMGGIGKTVLAQALYEHELTIFHFDVRAWITISHGHNVREDLSGLFRCINKQRGVGDELTECDVLELKTILYKQLYGRRYLIVLDDTWSTNCWDAIRHCFPNNCNGSRIILTTRESNVARSISPTHVHQVQLMDVYESWSLLRKIVFGEEDCPYVLERIGRKIASDCEGLPLAINVIGGILSKVERSKDFWEIIANDASVAIALLDDNEFCNLLSFYYNQLPNQLKPCFLYLGAFPKDYHFTGSRLKRMWVAEGFVKSNGDKSLEEEAEYYLESLVERNLVLVTEKKWNGKSRCYKMHGFLGYLCRRKSSEENLMHVKNARVDQGALHKVRRVSVLTASNEMEKEMYAGPFARSFICVDADVSPEIVSPVFLVLRLLRVLDVLDMQFKEFPIEVLELVNLRYLAFSCSSKSDIPKEISRLLLLQTLIGDIMWGNVAAEIWKISELRHLQLQAELNFKEVCMKQIMQENLLTVAWVTCDPFVIRMGFFKTIPNIKNLGIYFLESGDVVDLRHLHKLQTLRCKFDVDGYPWRYLMAIIFPYNLIKLSLQGCLIFGRDLQRILHALPNLEELRLSDAVFKNVKFVEIGFSHQRLRKFTLSASLIFPRDMTALLRALPNLEVLKLSKCVLKDEEFVLTEDDKFCSLRSLHLEELDNLVRWRADENNFPNLRELVIRECPVLEEIPYEFEDISTLERIELCKCSPSLEASAREIQEMLLQEYDHNLQLEII